MSRYWYKQSILLTTAVVVTTSRAAFGFRAVAIVPNHQPGFGVTGRSSFSSRRLEDLSSVATRNTYDEISARATSLFYKNDPEDNDQIQIVTELPSLEDLPRAAMERQVRERLYTPVGVAELYIGRVAMVAAIFFFVTEIFTGRSLPEQILDTLL
eukprot:CAMPEP_0172424494 /NCGR_PEP_ID=MMETSP1064-20121228/25740_1 /TAXON_ID=202472 /ORGANISM="Aulacoseira subarctica , Strain CCAP 1002/5" /LENGTH=154 /DNA_ID=CAMNT_0013166631 /DNA_START=81 /DNA_END=545 /DNA_ORIENTATION=-